MPATKPPDFAPPAPGEDDDSRIARLHAGGVEPGEIAVRLGLTRPAVLARLVALGLAAPGPADPGGGP